MGSAGKPVPNVQIKIVHPDPESGIGEIQARGPNIMKGYYKNEKLTAETIDADGWLATGDLGYLDNFGNLHIKGRTKSVIVLSHGENIYPEAIEDKINTDIHVVESLVVANNDRLEALVYLDYDLVDDETRGKSHEEKKAHIDALLASIKKEVNARAAPVRLSGESCGAHRTFYQDGHSQDQAISLLSIFKPRLSPVSFGYPMDETFTASTPPERRAG